MAVRPEPIPVERVLCLINSLDDMALLNLTEATNEVLRKHDWFTSIDGFKLGAVLFDAKSGTVFREVEDHIVSGEFVRMLGRTLQERLDNTGGLTT